MNQRGKLILIEGTDASGKETQTDLLLKRLNAEGLPAVSMSFPRYETPTGRIVGQCYLGKKDLGERFGWQGEYSWLGPAHEVSPQIASLFYAADRFAAKPEIEKILNSGQHLVLNRYVESNMAHQGGKKGVQNPEFFPTIEFIEELEYKLGRLPRPDKTIFLYMPTPIAEVLLTNRGGHKDGHENRQHLEMARDAYLLLARRGGWDRIDCAPDETMDSLKPKAQIHEEVFAKARELILYNQSLF